MTSAVCFSGSDISGTNRKTFIYVETKGNITINDRKVICDRGYYCEYPADAFIDGDRKPPTAGYLDDNCLIVENPTNMTTYRQGYEFKVLIIAYRSNYKTDDCF